VDRDVAGAAQRRRAHPVASALTASCGPRDLGTLGVVGTVGRRVGTGVIAVLAAAFVAQALHLGSFAPLLLGGALVAANLGLLGWRPGVRPWHRPTPGGSSARWR
jgi:hypothetical protein